MTALDNFLQPHLTSPSTAFNTLNGVPGNSSSNDNNGDASSESSRWQYSTSDTSDLSSMEDSVKIFDDFKEDQQASSSSTEVFPKIPWMRNHEYSESLEGLHYELIECFTWLKPSDQERFARVNVCERVKKALHTVCPDSILSVYGSVATTLFLPSSDIDISVESTRLSHYDMQQIASAFRNSNNFKDVTVLDRAYVPIIKLMDLQTGIHIDISFNSQRAYKAVEYIMFMKRYYPALELVSLILKQFLADRLLNQAFTGGLSSYGLVLMIVHYMLRFYQFEFYGKQLSELRPGVLGEFFMKFLNYYGSDFDPLSDALAFPQPLEAILLPKSELTAIMGEQMFNSIICIQDPLQPGNDVGRGAHNFMQIRAAFQVAWGRIEEVLSGKRRLIRNEPILHMVLSFPKNFQKQRKKILDLPLEPPKWDLNALAFNHGLPMAIPEFLPNYPVMYMPDSTPLFTPPYHQRVYMPVYFAAVPVPTSSTDDSEDSEQEATGTTNSDAESQCETITPETAETASISGDTDNLQGPPMQPFYDFSSQRLPQFNTRAPAFAPFLPLHYPPMPLAFMPNFPPYPGFIPQTTKIESDDDIDEAVRRLNIAGSHDTFSDAEPKTDGTRREDSSAISTSSGSGSVTGCSTVSPDCEDTVDNLCYSTELESD